MKEKIAIIIAIFIIIVSIFFYNLIEIMMILHHMNVKNMIKIIIYVQMYMIY